MLILFWGEGGFVKLCKAPRLCDWKTYLCLCVYGPSVLPGTAVYGVAHVNSETILDSFSTKRLVATQTQTQRNPLVTTNQKGRICHTPISHWLIYLGNGFEFTLQITFGA